MKTRTSILIDAEILKQAQELGINVSQFTEYALSQTINCISNLNFKEGIGNVVSDKCGRRDLNPGRQRGRLETATGSVDLARVDWDDYREWLLRNHKPHTVVSLVSYAKKFGHCLVTHDLSEVRDLRDSFRPNVVRALSNLAKYLGVYEDWKELVKQYGLKWTGRSTDELLIDRLMKVQNPDEVFEWIRQVKAAREDLRVFMDFIAVTGLRLDEAVQSYNLIIALFRKGELCNYYNEENETLEHFKFKEVFIRKSKKAFASFVSKELVKEICVSEPFKSKHAVQKRVRLTNLPLRFADVREMHASFLTKYLKPPEIDFLHGRVSANVFMQNYFNPKLIADLKERVFKGIAEIQTKILRG